MASLTTQEVAEQLGVSRRRVQQFINEGRLPAEKKGRDWLIKDEDLHLVADRKPGRRPANQPANEVSTETKQK